MKWVYALLLVSGANVFAANANTALSNLASTALNADIVPATNVTRSLGAQYLAYVEVWTQNIHDSAGARAIDMSTNSVDIFLDAPAGAVRTNGYFGPDNSDSAGQTLGSSTLIWYSATLDHLIFQQSTAASAAVNANAGSSATCTITSAADDGAGAVKIVTGTASWAAGSQCDITFGRAFDATPICLLTPADGATAQAAYSARFAYLSATTTVLSISFNSADTASNTYNFNYHCVENQ